MNFPNIWITVHKLAIDKLLLLIPFLKKKIKKEKPPRQPFVSLTLRDNHYICWDASDSGMYLLGKLFDFKARSPDFYRYWIADNEMIFLSDNSVNVEKGRDVMILSDELCEIPDEQVYFKIKKDEFIHLLNEWENISQYKPAEIMVVYNRPYA